jgi:benzoyl-CoA reductase/2-hydroxyglutaryl-CoA dehydratase subunit BcrC/BadD/HgdB
MESHRNETVTVSFENFLQMPFNALVEQAIHENRIPIGYTCSYIPEVMLSTGNLFPFRIRAQGVNGTEMADIYLTNMVCLYTRSILELAMDDQYHFLGGWVLAATCNQMHRLYDNLVYLIESDFIHILDVPHKTGDEALKWYVDELYRLKERIEIQFGTDLSDRSLSEAIHRYNDFQYLMKSIDTFRLQENPPLSGTDYHRLVTATTVSPKDLIYHKVIQYRDSLADRNPINEYRARLMIVGGQMDDPEFIRCIESTGALVVADRMCTGSLTGFDIIHTDNEPLYDIAAHYLRKVSCPRMMEDFRNRMAAIVETAREYNVDGVIIHHIKFCDIWGIESRILSSRLRKSNIPVLCLDREYVMAGEGQIRTRVQAFLESMGK